MLRGKDWYKQELLLVSLSPMRAVMKCWKRVGIQQATRYDKGEYGVGWSLVVTFLNEAQQHWPVTTEMLQSYK